MLPLLFLASGVKDRFAGLQRRCEEEAEEGFLRARQHPGQWRPLFCQTRPLPSSRRLVAFLAFFLLCLKSFKRQINLCVCVLEFCIKRDPEWGGDKAYTEFEEVEKDFADEVEERDACFLFDPKDDVDPSLMFDFFRPSTQET